MFTLAENPEWVPPIPFLTRAVLDFAFAWLILRLFRTRGESLPAQATVGRSFTPEVAEFLRTIPWWRSFRLWAALLVICVVARDWQFLCPTFPCRRCRHAKFSSAAKCGRGRCG